MKMSARPYIFGLFLMLASLVQPVFAQDLLPAYPQLSAYDHYAAYDKSGDVYLFDGDSNSEKKISTHNSVNGYAGITVLSTGVYWGEWEIGGDVYFYDFSTQQTSILVSMVSVGDMEKNNGLSQFRMLSYNFFEYTLLKQGKDSIYSEKKYYNATTKKAYGQTDFDTYGAHGTEIHGDKYEVFRLNSAEKFLQGNGIYNFTSVAMDDNNLLMFGHGNYGSGAKADEYIQYRIFNTVNGTTLKFNDDSQKNISYTDFITPNNQFSYTNFTLGSKSTDPEKDQSPTAYYRLDRKSPYTSELVTTIPYYSANNQLRAYDADSLVWGSDSVQTWYRTDDKQICTLAKSIPLHTMGTRTFAFWRDGATLKAQKLLCVGDAANQPVNVKEQKTPSTPTITKTVPANVKTLIKAKGSPSIYYLGADGKRYVFYNADIYFTWYRDFSSVKTVSPNEMGAIPIGGNVTFRPGTLVKIQSDPRVYAVDRGGTLRWVVGEKQASGIFGTKWTKKIKTIPDFLFVNYRIGEDIRSASDFNQAQVQMENPDINTDKGL